MSTSDRSQAVVPYVALIDIDNPRPTEVGRNTSYDHLVEEVIQAMCRGLQWEVTVWRGDELTAIISPDRRVCRIRD